MADAKLTQLTESTDIADDSLLYIVKDPGTVPLSRKMTFANFSLELGMIPQSGWVELPSSDSWTALSTTDPYSVTVPAGAESIYDKGDKVRLKQGGAYKYFYIYGTTDTVLDITGGSDYTLTTDAITNVAYSKIENPLDFPHWFNWSALHDGFAVAPTCTARFRLIGTACYITYFVSVLGTSNAVNYAVTLPITAKTGVDYSDSLGWTADNGGYVANGIITIASAATQANLYKSAYTTWTNANGKGATFLTWYEIA